MLRRVVLFFSNAIATFIYLGFLYGIAVSESRQFSWIISIDELENESSHLQR